MRYLANTVTPACLKQDLQLRLSGRVREMEGCRCSSVVSGDLTCAALVPSPVLQRRVGGVKQVAEKGFASL